MFTSQTEKYLNVERKVVFTNTTDWSRDGWDVICYDDSWTYPEKVCHCLEQVDSETCMINLEDFPLYDKPNIEKLKQINEEVKKTSLDFVKLMKGIDSLNLPLWIDGMYRVPLDSEYLFAYQPSIWKTKKLKELFERSKQNCKNKTAHHFEPLVQRHAREMNLFGGFIYEGEPKRGQHHFDSWIYPFIATAIVRGKWNTSEYKKELDILFNEYKIDPSIRGEV